MENRIGEYTTPICEEYKRIGLIQQKFLLRRAFEASKILERFEIWKVAALWESTISDPKNGQHFEQRPRGTSQDILTRQFRSKNLKDNCNHDCLSDWHF